MDYEVGEVSGCSAVVGSQQGEGIFSRAHLDEGRPAVRAGRLSLRFGLGSHVGGGSGVGFLHGGVCRYA